MLLSLHSWPGNVRELENVLGHACMMAMGDTIDVQDLPAYLRSHGRAERESAAAHARLRGRHAGGAGALLIVRALEAAGGNQSKAARALRIGRDALRYKLKKHNLETTRLERDSATAE
jgi:DNA-binding NtrC family response regulator